MNRLLALIVVMCLLFNGLCFGWCPEYDFTDDCRVNIADFALFAGQWLLEGENAVPDVVGMTQSAAETAITDVYLAVGTIAEQYSDTIDPNIVMAQDPNAGVLLGPDEPVDLVVSLGPFPSPDITWVYINDPGVSGHEPFTGYMSKYETTNAQYCQFLNEALASGDIYVSNDRVYGSNGSNSGTDYVDQVYFDTSNYTSFSQITWNGSSFSVRTRDGHDMSNHPVVMVSWYGSMAFADYYGWRLPTEWEWQAVADYDGSYIYGCGTTINQSKANYDYVNPLSLSSYPYTSPVNHYPSYGYGMNDMAGNVWEWTSTVSGSYRVLRGGSWYYDDRYCEVSYRLSPYPHNSSYHYGFRVCR